MDKIRKICETIWFAKEKVVLVVMIGILIWYVIKIFIPPQATQAKHFSPPGSTAPLEIAGFEPVAEPAAKPGPDLAAIYTPHPFWYSGTGNTTTQSPAATEEPAETP